MAKIYGPPLSKAPRSVQNLYAQMRAPSRAAVPIPATPDLGQVQPDFTQSPSISMDPMQAGAVPRQGLLGMAPPNIGLHPGAENMTGTQYEQAQGRGKNLNVYQDPLEYETHLNTVMNSPMMKELAAGTDRMKQLREDFLKTAPTQTDLSPVMALADYLAKGKGTAQSGYKRPASYEDMVSNIHDMLGSEQKSRQANAQLAFEQAGGLKSGTEEATTKTQATDKNEQGYKIPNPPMAVLGMPFRQAQDIGSSYEKMAKDANDTVQNAINTRKLLANPGWYTSNALKGSIVKSIGVNRITQNELFLLGGGSQDFISQVDRAIQKSVSGDPLLASDRHAIETYNELSLKGALEKRDQIKAQMGQGYQGVTMLPGSKVNQVMTGRDVPIPAEQAGTGVDKSDAFASQFMDLMKGKK